MQTDQKYSKNQLILSKAAFERAIKRPDLKSYTAFTEHTGIASYYKQNFNGSQTLYIGRYDEIMCDFIQNKISSYIVLNLLHSLFCRVRYAAIE